MLWYSCGRIVWRQRTLPTSSPPIKTESNNSGAAVELQGVGKTYPLFAGPRDRFRQLWGGVASVKDGVDALMDINLTVERGQIFGIVGKNGSGKSTLLRLLSGVLTPTSGSIEVSGRVAALLELGAGFNPEFSGRDNVLMTCALLGIDDNSALESLPRIEAFADVGAFFDRPVKTYSTGMYARVAFAALAVCEPDVLILDEILAVGDEAFQRKCLARLEALAASGCTIILVTHNSQLVVEFCQAAVLLADGRVVIAGDPKSVVHEYYRQQGFSQSDELPGGGFAASSLPSAPVSAWYDAALLSASMATYGNGDAKIENVRLIDASGARVNVLVRGSSYRLCYRVVTLAPAQNLEFGCLIKNTRGVELGGLVLGKHTELTAVVADACIDVSFPFVASLLPGSYFFNAGVRADLDGVPNYLHRIMDALMFRVQEETGHGLSGIVDFSATEERPSFEVATL